MTIEERYAYWRGIIDLQTTSGRKKSGLMEW
jgi:hypothetical protein